MWEIELSSLNDSVITPWRERCANGSPCRATMNSSYDGGYLHSESWIYYLFTFGSDLHVHSSLSPFLMYVFHTLNDSWSMQCVKNTTCCIDELDTNCPPSNRLGTDRLWRDSVIRLYSSGGQFGEAFAIWKFNMTTRLWSKVCGKVARTPEHLSTTSCGEIVPGYQQFIVSATVVDDIIYLFGGSVDGLNSAGYASNDLWIFNLSEELPQWNVLCRGTVFVPGIENSHQDIVDCLYENQFCNPEEDCQSVRLSFFPDIAPTCDANPHERLWSHVVGVDRPEIGDRVLLLYGGIDNSASVSYEHRDQLSSIWLYGESL